MSLEQALNEFMGTSAQIKNLIWEDRHQKLKEALQKISNPIKYHYWEADPYNPYIRANCFQSIAQEALEEDEQKD